jgi:hypothetical protein
VNVSKAVHSILYSVLLYYVHYMRQTMIRNLVLKPDERPRRRWKDDVETDFRNRVSAWCFLRRVITLCVLRRVITQCVLRRVITHCVLRRVITQCVLRRLTQWLPIFEHCNEMSEICLTAVLLAVTKDCAHRVVVSTCVQKTDNGRSARRVTAVSALTCAKSFTQSVIRNTSLLWDSNLCVESDSRNLHFPKTSALKHPNMYRVGQNGLPHFKG